MSKADFTARIKKIEILNKYTAESWKQSIRVILDEIELSNENLLELRQFSPNEEVLVVLSSVQRGLFDHLAGGKMAGKTTESPATVSSGPAYEAPPAGDGRGSGEGKAPLPAEELVQGEEEGGAFVTVQEEPFIPAEAALHSWSFEPEPGYSAGDARPGWSPAGQEVERSELAAPRISHGR
ncbi:MAG: hypothetical protein ACUVTU_02930 [Desulfurispora sp.]|uniref:hypothetical protein n=1 Tax=Desulfurispora sp. TaxID=3014275 RepID=UPI0040499B93